jgi:amino acid transporter
MTVIVAISAAPVLAQQFTTLIDVAVLVSLAMYILSAGALWRLSRDEANRGRRLFVRAAAAASIVFCTGVVLTSRPLLLGLGVAVAVMAGLAYGFARGRQLPRTS